jgi:hypothetical protein
VRSMPHAELSDNSDLVERGKFLMSKWGYNPTSVYSKRDSLAYRS